MDKLKGTYTLPFTERPHILLPLDPDFPFLYGTYLSSVEYHVPSAISCLGEALFTKATFKWLLSGVGRIMSLQVVWAAEFLPTFWKITSIRLHSFVPAHVVHQIFSICEYFPAARLLAHQFLGTNSKCMNIGGKDFHACMQCYNNCDMFSVIIITFA
jgi:hypothetical protein